MTIDLHPTVIQAAEYLDACAATVDDVLTELMKPSDEPVAIRRAQLDVANQEHKRLVELIRQLRAANGNPQRMLGVARDILAFPGVTLPPAVLQKRN